MLTLAIIVGSIVGGGTVITVSALSFTKWYMERVEGHDKPEPPKPKTYIDLMAVLPGGEKKTCPFCSVTRGQNMLNGIWFFETIRKERNAIQTTARKQDSTGPTSGYMLSNRGQQYLYQGCTRCLAEWLNG